ncbi:MAG: twin-arginine translocase subunit TatC [Solirubrobacteraceae bacterium]|jgi:sec-independent protein translocase protein TatC
MPKVLRPIGHEDRLSIVDHLDELRSRLFVCAGALVATFALCFVGNHVILNLLNAPISSATAQQPNHLGGLTTDSVAAAHHLENSAQLLSRLSRSSHLAPADAGVLAAAAQQLYAGARALPQKAPKQIPVTLGVGEGFTTTLTVCFYSAILLALPVLLYELFAFVIPALSPEERRIAGPIVIAAPFLFVLGVVFTYLIVLPAAIRFLQGYNASEFQNLLQAKPLYSFEVLTMGAIGLAFQMPIALLGLRQAGVINGSTLTRHWRYATVIIAVLAAAMPGADPVTTALETAPLIILFIASIVLLKLADRRDARRAAAALTSLGATGDAEGGE